ncbi:hypothetical protein ABPG72_010858 [Tetrahymena utriculariae]
MMMVCYAIFAFTTNSIGEIFQDFYQKDNIIREKMFIIRVSMIKKGVSKSNMKGVYEYIEYYWIEKRDENLYNYNKECCFYKDNFIYETLLRCLTTIQEQRCSTEGAIYDSEIGDSNTWLYFIQQRELEVYIQTPDYSNKRKIQFQNSAIAIIKSRMFRLLSGKQIDMINDKTYFKEEKLQFFQVNNLVVQRSLSVRSKVNSIIYHNQSPKKKAAKISYQAYDISQFQQQPNNNINNNYNTQTWIDLMQLTDSSWLVKYIYSYYFITVTMATVGDGDIKPTTVIEIIVCTVLMMVCCAIFAFTINSIGQIFQDFYQKENIIRQKRFIIGNYMIQKGVSKSTMKDVYEYLEYYWKEKSDENLQEENQIISQLSNSLRQELLAESNRIIFKECSFFKDNFSYETLLRCLPIIQEQRCTPEEIVYDSEIGDSDVWLYFIQQGELDVYIQSPDYSNKRKILFQNSAITILKQFGEVSFFTGEQPKLSLKSLNFSKLLKIKRSDFIKVRIEDKEEYETFQKIYGQLLKSVSHLKREKMKIERSIKYKQPTLENLENYNERYFQYLNDKYEDLVFYEEKYIDVFPYLRQNSCFAFPPEEKIELLNYKINDQNAKESNVNLNICNNIPPNINVISQSDSQTESNSKENISTIHFNPLNSILTQQNQQLIHQISSNMKQTSNTKKNLSVVKQVSFQKSIQNLCEEELPEQNEDFQENSKLKQKILQERDSSFSQYKQIYTTHTNSSSLQSLKLQEPCPSNQQNNKQITVRQTTKDYSGLVTFKSDLQNRSSLQVINCSNSSNNNIMNCQLENRFTQSQKYIQSLSQMPRQFSEMYIRRLTQYEINKQETINDQFDCFLGQFEKMRRMTNYFPYFNYKIVLEKLNKKRKKLNNSRKESLKAEYARSLINHGLINKSRNRNSQKNILLSQNFMNYKQQRKDQRMNSSLFKAESKIMSSENLKVKSHFVTNKLSQDSQEKSQFFQNLEEFITQEVNNFSASKIDPNTPSQSFANEQEFKNQKEVQIFNKKTSYDFQ